MLLPSHHRCPASASARLPVRRRVTAEAAALRRGRTARLVVLPRQLGPGLAVVSTAAPPGESKSVTAALGRSLPLRRVNPSQ